MAPDLNSLALLPDGECSEKDRNEPILAKRQTELRMAGDLKLEVTVPALIYKDVFRRPPERQSAQHKRTRGEAKILTFLIPVQPNKLDAFDLAKLLLGNEQAGLEILDDRTSSLERLTQLYTPPQMELPWKRRSPKRTSLGWF